MTIKARLFVVSSFLIFVIPASFYTWNSFFYDTKSFQNSFLKELDKVKTHLEEYRTSSDEALEKVNTNLGNALLNLQARIDTLSETVEKRRRISLDFKMRTTKAPVMSTTRLPTETTSEIKQNNSCIDTLEKELGNVVELYPCHGEGRNQAWQLTSDKLIRNGVIYACLSSKEGDDVVIETRPCNKADRYQLWERFGKAIRLVGTNKCLDVIKDSKALIARVCRESSTSQEWSV